MSETDGGMTLAEFQAAAVRTWQPVDHGPGDLAYLGLGLMGEAGEVAEHIKKHFRHGHGLDEVHLQAELGDVLWYAAVLADVLGLDLGRVASGNVAKLKARYPDGFSEERSRTREHEVISETLREL